MLIDIIGLQLRLGLMEKFANSSFHIAIIGGGFSGTCLAAELLRSGDPAVCVTLIERSAFPGRGVAFGTQCAGHLLNVPTQKMSALAGDSSHFLRWAQRNYNSAVQPGDFLPRRVYGRYIASVLQEAFDANDHRFAWKRDEAVSVNLVEDKAEISLRNGSRISADKIVLALGNFPPAALRVPGITQSSPRFVSNPWLESAFDNVARDTSILLVGSGLTSVDAVISLRERGFRGKIHMLSRHGLLPQSHRAAQPWPAFAGGDSPCTARRLLQLIREQVSLAEECGGDWRAVLDSLRPMTQTIWRSLPLKEQRRFLRHLRAYWDVHRHRVAPQIGKKLKTEIRVGKLQIHAGRLVEHCEGARHVDVIYRERRSGGLRTLKVDRVINCTGPDADIRRVDSPLLRDLIRRNLARTDPLFLGLDTAPDGALVGSEGTYSEFLFAIGPLRKGNLWESTAVPEIRLQAAQLASQLIQAHKQPLRALREEQLTA
jgi:uncharacterized NAD(P)/FAD-binding protein YdhS